MTIIKKVLSIVLCLVLILPISGCKKNKNSPENQTIKYNLGSEPKTLDPQICTDASSNIVVLNTFEGLVRLGANGEITPGVAQAWELSDDGLNYIFHLREDACWSDSEKTPVTAHDFVFGFRRTLSSYTDSPKAYTLYCIKNARKVHLNGASVTSLGVTATDPHTLAVELEYPVENFLAILSTPPTMPCNQAFFEKTNGQYGLESNMIIGNGAFCVKNRYGWDHYNTLNLTKNENYHGENVPVPAGVSFTIGKDTSDAVSLIKNSTLDVVLLPESQISLANKEKLPLTSFKDTLWGLSFNTADALFSNLNIRKGFITALNRENMLSTLPEYCEHADDIVIDGLTVNGQNFRDVAGSSLYLKQDSQAKKFFEEGMDQLKLKRLPTVTILCPDSTAIKAIVSNMIENLNSTLGYYFNMEPISDNNLRSRIASSSYQIAFLPLSVDSQFALDFLNSFNSKNSKNVANLSSPDYDKLLNAAISATPKDSIKHLISAEKYINENVIFYPMYTQNRFFAQTKKLSNLIFHNYNQGIDFFFATKRK